MAFCAFAWQHNEFTANLKLHLNVSACTEVYRSCSPQTALLSLLSLLSLLAPGFRMAFCGATALDRRFAAAT